MVTGFLGLLLHEIPGDFQVLQVLKSPKSPGLGIFNGDPPLRSKQDFVGAKGKDW